MKDKKQYEELFRSRKWMLAFDAMPLNRPKAIPIGSVSDFIVIRVRASDYNRANTSRRVSISIDYEKSEAIVVVKKK